MDIEISEQTFKNLKRVGVAIVGIIVIIVLASILVPLNSPSAAEVLLNKTAQIGSTKPLPPATQVQTLISQICADRDLAIKYEQDPASSHPQLIKLRPLVQQYEQVTGKKFSSNLCPVIG